MASRELSSNTWLWARLYLLPCSMITLIAHDGGTRVEMNLPRIHKARMCQGATDPKRTPQFMEAAEILEA